MVCSKTVQKVVEITLPLTLFDAGLNLTNLISVNVVPNIAGITDNARIIEDKVVIIGLVPTTISVTAAGLSIAPFTTTIPFQQEIYCPESCPEDMLIETSLQVEGIFVQPGVPVLSVTGLTLVRGILIEFILRTTITVTRPILVDEHGNFCDIADRRL